MSYIWVILFFISYILYSLLIDRLTKDEKEKRKETKEQLEPLVQEEEKKYNMESKKTPFLNTRMMSLFMQVEKEEEKETLREKFLVIVEEQKMKPARFFVLTISKAFFFVFIIYGTLFLLPVPSNPILSYTTIAVATFSMALNKRWFFTILILALGLWLYPRMSGSLMLLILLNRLWSLGKQLIKNGKKKDEK